jgi:ABC-type spermidine/putrescine transport system permease subunit I
MSILPLTLPASWSGAFLTFVLAIGDYITPQILGGGNELLMPQLIMMQIGPSRRFRQRLGAVHHPDAGRHPCLSPLRPLLKIERA